MNYKVGTRGSKLALTQTGQVIDLLKKAYPRDEFEIVVIETTGDKNRKLAIEELGSKGVFVDTIEKALKEGSIALAVHSMKDMPDKPLEGLVFTKPLKREDPRDVLILREANSLSDIRVNGRIGTGSKRRIYQLKKLRPDLEMVPIRGNIDTRLRKLREADSEGKMLDGIVLAAAGLKRLGLESEITQYLSVDEMIPAPCQGILALEVNKENSELMEKINCLHDADTEKSVRMERGFLERISAGCQDPVGAYFQKEGSEWVFRTVFGKPDGSDMKTLIFKGDNYDSLIEEAVKAYMDN